MGLIPGVESVTELDDLTDRIQRVKRTFIDVEREVYRWLKIHDGEYRAHKKRKCEEEQQAQAQQAPVEPEQQAVVAACDQIVVGPSCKNAGNGKSVVKGEQNVKRPLFQGADPGPSCSSDPVPRTIPEYFPQQKNARHRTSNEPPTSTGTQSNEKRDRKKVKRGR